MLPWYFKQFGEFNKEGVVASGHGASAQEEQMVGFALMSLERIRRAAVRAAYFAAPRWDAAALGSALPPRGEINDRVTSCFEQRSHLIV